MLTLDGTLAHMLTCVVVLSCVLPMHSVVVPVPAGVWRLPHPAVHGPALLLGDGGQVPAVLAADHCGAHCLHAAYLLLQGHEEVRPRWLWTHTRAHFCLCTYVHTEVIISSLVKDRWLC